MASCPIPHHQADLATANVLCHYDQAVSAEEYQRLLIWLKDEHWPVFPAVATFLARQGTAGREPLLRVLRSKNNLWKKHIIDHVLSTWPGADLEPLAPLLCTLVTDPDPYGPDTAAAQLLLRHHLADPRWLQQWLKHKRQTLSAKVTELETLLLQLADPPPQD